jgi:uncharacterized protein
MKNWRTLSFLVWMALKVGLLAAEVLPKTPDRYFNDYAGVVSRNTADRLNKSLEDFEKETSNQILVAVYPKMQSDSSIEDYTVRLAEAWKVGQRLKNNGAVLFVFVQDRAMFLQVGYGLEGALPDALAKRIIEDEIKPYFRKGDFDGGLTAGLTAILQATRGEYKGTGRTAADGRTGQPKINPLAVFVIFIILFFIIGRLNRASGTEFGRHGRRYRRGWPGGGWGGGGWSGGGGGWTSGGGGGFSGGGGSFGGGGAGGRW